MFYEATQIELLLHLKIKVNKTLMTQILETKRLTLRELNINDSENFYNLNLNPNVIKYTGNSAFKNIDEAKDFLENYQDYQLNGFGRWAVIEKI